MFNIVHSCDCYQVCICLKSLVLLLVNLILLTRRVFGFHRWESVKCFICGLGKLNFIHIHMESVLRRFFKKLYFSSNSVFQVLSKVSCNRKYCQQFLKEVDLALDQSKWHIDKFLFRHFLDVALMRFFSFFVFLVYCTAVLLVFLFWTNKRIMLSC